tara:strand:- start:812 stop:1003 length:192 start_codon:yes stop_codon:yes gene_type:complete
MEAIKIEDVKKGDFIRRKPDAKTTFTKGDYCRFEKKYELGDWDDISRSVYLKKGTIVYIDFTF